MLFIKNLIQKYEMNKVCPYSLYLSLQKKQILLIQPNNNFKQFGMDIYLMNLNYAKLEMFLIKNVCFVCNLKFLERLLFHNNTLDKKEIKRRVRSHPYPKNG